MKTFKILGLLLSYPEKEIVNNLDDLQSLLEQEKLLPKKRYDAILTLVHRLKTEDLIHLQENYVDVFDRGRAHCLHLFEHVHGESRDRGQAMVDLATMYEQKGLHINAHELPDYLPLFLEYLSCCSFDEAQELLGEAMDVIAIIGAKLKRDKSDYYVLFDALAALLDTKIDHKAIVAELAKTPNDENSLAAIDKEWEEAAAFGDNPEQSDCNDCSSFAASDAPQKITINGGVR